MTKKIGWVNDKVIHGTVVLTGRACDVCGEEVAVLSIREVVLPKGMKPSTKLILYDGHDDPQLIKNLGIGCGCYARAHRQIAHITRRVQANDSKRTRR